mmetsp:Transcript_2205/g.6557  ORF Transcript_2205/g.6557 Transcript_2205/m.6557 type:complete len:438 (-) Transcript_2205:179-1492(-)
MRRFLVLVALTATVAAKTWSPEVYPNPNTNAAQCHRSGRGMSAVCDPDDVVSDEERDTLEGIINRIYEGEKPFKKTHCGNHIVGYEVAVALVKKMDVEILGHTNTAERAKAFAKALHDSWGVGDATCNTGVLLFLSLDDHYMYISTGSGAAGYLTDSRIEDIIADAKDLLRAGETDKAIEELVVSIGVQLVSKPTLGERIGNFFSWLSQIIVTGFVILIVIFTLFNLCAAPVHRYRRMQRLKKLKEQLGRVQEERDRSQETPTYQSTSCPICLEDFQPAEGGNQAAQRKHRLACGHTFHSSCIEQWLQTARNTSCPICRRDAFDGSNPPDSGSSTTTPPGPSCYDQQTGQYTTTPEVNFRLGRLQAWYPDLLTAELLATWNSNIHADYVNDLNREVLTALQAGFNSRSEAAYSGASGSTFSFGGGGSAGGGGGGGGW